MIDEYSMHFTHLSLTCPKKERYALLSIEYKQV